MTTRNFTTLALTILAMILVDLQADLADASTLVVSDFAPGRSYSTTGDGTDWNGTANGQYYAGNRTGLNPLANNDRSGRIFVFFTPSAAERQEVKDSLGVTFDFTLIQILNTGDLEDLEIAFFGHADTTIDEALWDTDGTEVFASVLTPGSSLGDYSLDVSSISASTFDLDMDQWVFALRATSAPGNDRHDHGAVDDAYQFDGTLADFTLTVTAVPVPEPSTFMLLGLGALGLVRHTRRRRRRA